VTKWGSIITWANGIVWTKRHDLTGVYTDTPSGGQSTIVQLGTVLYFGSTHPVTWTRGRGLVNARGALSAQFDDMSFSSGTVQLDGSIDWDNGHVWTRVQSNDLSQDVSGVYDSSSPTQFIAQSGSHIYATCDVDTSFWTTANGTIVNSTLDMNFWYKGTFQKHQTAEVWSYGETIQWDFPAPSNVWVKKHALSGLYVHSTTSGVLWNIVVQHGADIYFGFTIRDGIHRETWTRGRGTVSFYNQNITAMFDNGVEMTAVAVGYAPLKLQWNNGDVWGRPGGL